MQRVLSFDQTPPLSVPLRFFLTAPLFATCAALVLLLHGSDALASRWSPVALSITHLLTLGFLAMAMFGALLQMLPVVAGVQIPRASLTAQITHGSLGIGAIILCMAFFTMTPWLFKLAIPFLLLAFLWLIAVCVIGILRTPGHTVILTAIKIALACLLFTVLLGVAAAATLAWQLRLPFLSFFTLTNLHVSFGLIGWVSLLIIGVAFQVVPMFQVTPLYPKIISRWLPHTVFALLAAWSVSTIVFQNVSEQWPNIFADLIALALILFSLSTLYLLWKRKRPKPDPTTFFWLTGLVSLLLCASIWLVGSLFPAVADSPRFSLTLGVLFIAGFAYSVVNGMLYKIVPFLVWYHLQENMDRRYGKAPNVKQIVTDSNANKQFICHLTAVILILSALFWPEAFARVAGAAFAISSLWLCKNLFQAAGMYQRLLPVLQGKVEQLAG